MSYGLVKESTLTGIADAIRAKNGSTATYKPSEMAAAIAALTGSSTSTEATASVSEGVEFVDHDGTVLYSYTWDEVTALTDLPDLPTWTVETVGGYTIPMTCQGWQYTLARLQEIGEGYVRVGCTYTPTDGKTHMICRLGEQGDIDLRLTPSVADSAVIIDWGDGTTTATDSTSATTYSHEYGNTADGYYDVTITADSGTAQFTAVTSSTSTSSSAVRINCMNATGVSSSSYYNLRWRQGTLCELYIGDAITAINSCALCYSRALTTVTIPEGVTSIGSYAFYYCCSLTSVVIPEGVTSIGSGAFAYCYSLTSVVILEGVTSIDTYAFRYCYSLTSVVIPEGVTSIGTYAFASCYSLTSVTIPEGVTSIGSGAFAYCYNLTSVVIPEGVTSIGAYAFASCYSLTSVVIPEGVTSIGSEAFAYCYSLTSVVIPEGVTSIDDYAFYYCYSLTSVVIPEGVTSIGNYAFYYCCSLTSVVIPEGVTSIGTYAFQYSGLVRLDGLYIADTDTETAIFTYCYRLIYLTNVYYVGASISFSQSPLDYDSTINLFNGLSSTSTGTVTLSSDTYSLLDDDDMAIATDKGWTVASA